MNEELILAIESSCDETSVAVVRNGTEILSNFRHHSAKTFMTVYLGSNDVR